jgi:hypothetical protein
MLPSAACRAPLPSMNCATNKSLEPSLLARTAPQLATNGTGLFSDWDYCSGVLVLRSGSDPAACYCGGRNGKRGPKGGMIGPARLGLTRDCWSLTDRPTRPYGSRSVTLGVLTPIWDAVTCGVPKPGHGICPAFLWAGFVLVDEPVGDVPDFWNPTGALQRRAVPHTLPYTIEPVGARNPAHNRSRCRYCSWTCPSSVALMLIYRHTRRRSLRGARGATASRTTRPLDERRGGDPDASIRIAQGRQLAARDERADARDRQTQPTGRLGQGECGPPVDPHHRAHCARNGPRGPVPMHKHLHEQAGRWVQHSRQVRGSATQDGHSDSAAERREGLYQHRQLRCARGLWRSQGRTIECGDACGCREPCHVMRQCTYSCTRPPSRSRRSGRTVESEGGGVPPTGGR